MEARKRPPDASVARVRRLQQDPDDVVFVQTELGRMLWEAETLEEYPERLDVIVVEGDGDDAPERNLRAVKSAAPEELVDRVTDLVLSAGSGPRRARGDHRHPGQDQRVRELPEEIG